MTEVLIFTVAVFAVAGWGAALVYARRWRDSEDEFRNFLVESLHHAVEIARLLQELDGKIEELENPDRTVADLSRYRGKR